jgi:hypothetical protein
MTGKVLRNVIPCVKAVLFEVLLFAMRAQGTSKIWKRKQLSFGMILISG